MQYPVIFCIKLVLRQNQYLGPTGQLYEWVLMDTITGSNLG